MEVLIISRRQHLGGLVVVVQVGIIVQAFRQLLELPILVVAAVVVVLLAQQPHQAAPVS